MQQWAAGIITPQMAEEVDRTNNFPKDVDMWREMGSFGLLGAVSFAEDSMRGQTSREWESTVVWTCDSAKTAV